MVKLCKRVLIWWPNKLWKSWLCQSVRNRPGWYLIETPLYLEFEDPLDWPIDGCLSSKSVKQILWSPRHNTKDTSQDARRHHVCLAFNITWCQLAYHNQGWKYVAVRKDQDAIQTVTMIHNVLLIHIGEVKYCPQVLLLLWTKITWAVTMQEVAQPKPNPVLKT